MCSLCLLCLQPLVCPLSITRRYALRALLTFFFALFHLFLLFCFPTPVHWPGYGFCPFFFFFSLLLLILPTISSDCLCLKNRCSFSYLFFSSSATACFRASVFYFPLSFSDSKCDFGHDCGFSCDRETSLKCINHVSYRSENVVQPTQKRFQCGYFFADCTF